MPYKRAYKKKRYHKKKNARASKQFKLLRSISLLLNGKRKYRKEVRNDSVTAPQNEVYWYALEGIGDRDGIEGMITIEDSKQQVDNVPYSTAGTATIDGLGEIPTVGPYETNEGYYKHDITNYKMTYHFRNIEQHACHLTIYECVSAKTRPWTSIVSSSIPTQLITDLHTGFHKKSFDSTSSSTTRFIGFDDVGTLSGNGFPMKSQFVSPNSSEVFRGNWNIVKQKHYKLNPGDEVFWTMKTRNRVFNPKTMYNDDNDQNEDLDATFDAIDCVKNYTKTLLIRLHGVMGRKTDDVSVVGFINSDLSYDYIRSATLLPLMTRHRRDHFREVNIDDLSAVTVHGPTDFDVIAPHD